MSERLDLIKSLIVKADTIADVGCDHGLVAKYCAESGVAKRVIASDISEKSLQKARKLLLCADNVEFACCDGIDYLCDEAVISGMGGMLICDILRAARRLPKTVIVSAHTDHEKVRSCLLELGYGIDRDVALIERNKFYAVIRAVLGGGRTGLSDLQLFFGADCDKPSEALLTRLKSLYAVYMRASSRNAEKIARVKEALSMQGVKDTTFMLS